MSMTRRSTLGGLLAFGATATLPGVEFIGEALAQSRTRFPNPLKIPTVLNGKQEAGLFAFDLDVRAGTTEFLQGRQTPTIGVNGTFLGPLLRVKDGAKVRFNVRNELHEATTLHWHGLHLPARADGGPHQKIAAGATWSPEFVIKQKAGLYWYHSHLIGRTGAQVNAGLAAPIIVDDEESSALGLPSEYGVDVFCATGALIICLRCQTE